MAGAPRTGHFVLRRQCSVPALFQHEVHKAGTKITESFVSFVSFFVLFV
jgi:hypothetical protein